MGRLQREISLPCWRGSFTVNRARVEDSVGTVWPSGLGSCPMSRKIFGSR
jgi:hypothetical protein